MAAAKAAADAERRPDLGALHGYRFARQGRGTAIVEQNGKELRGEMDFTGQAVGRPEVRQGAQEGRRGEGPAQGRRPDRPVLERPVLERLSWNGLSWNGLSWNGLSWNGLSWNGLSWNGLSWNGLSWNGLSWNGLSWNGLSWNGLSWNGLSWNGLSWNSKSWS